MNTPVSQTSVNQTSIGHPSVSHRRRVLVAAVVLGSAAVVSGCSTLGGGVPGESVDARVALKPGTALVFRTLNGYNREQRSIATQTFSDTGSRLEGLDYQEASNGGFGKPTASMIAQEFNAAGDLVAVERADGTRTTFEPPLRVLPFPLVPGRSFRQDVFARDGDNARPRRVIMVARVGGWETVKVPAGEFRALRVTRDLYLGNFENHRTETQRLEMDWYAPDIGAVVRASEDSAHQDLMMGRGPFGAPNVMRGDFLIRELTGPVQGPVKP